MSLFFNNFLFLAGYSVAFYFIPNMIVRKKKISTFKLQIIDSKIKQIQIFKYLGIV